MGRCGICGQEAETIAEALGFCGPCIRTRFPEVWPDLAQVHRTSRERFGLPAMAPQADGGKHCSLCFHDCRIPEGGKGYCGARRVEQGRWVGGGPTGTAVSFYHDPLPTNCVADWFCPGGTGRGYPKYARQPGAEYGLVNLAVFYHTCNFNCLFCQNWTFKQPPATNLVLSAKQLAAAVNGRTSCICYFGGDPAPHLPHALATANLAQAGARSRGERLRICWETNGALQEPWLDPLVESSLDNGGIIKLDLKACSEEIHLALCGVSNAQTLQNFARLAQRFPERPEVPLLTASTLLVPGYIDTEEIQGLARLIASLNPDIPYSLLAFYPQFYLTDLPTTSRKQAEEARAVALAAGLTQVRIGNEHLLT